MATSSFQPLVFMDAMTSCGRQPASAWSMIQRRSSGVMAWAVAVVMAVILAQPDKLRHKLRARRRLR
jgi:hypothetical protein